MPYSSHAAARDDILTFFKAAWDVQTPPVPLAFYDNVKQDIPAVGTAWARVIVKHGLGEQVSIGGSPGNKLFRRYGLVTVQVFAPHGQGLTANDQYAKVAIDAFEGHSAPGGAFFYNVRSNEIGQSGDWFQTNVIAEFQWDQVK